MKSKSVVFLMIVLFFVGNTQKLKSQGVEINIPIKERIEKSSSLIQGRVINKECTWDVHRNSIFTKNYIEVWDDIKRNIITDTIILLTRGGVIDLDMQIDNPSLKLNIGEIGLFLINENGEYVQGDYPLFTPRFVSQSFIRYDLENYSAFDSYTNYQRIDKNLYEILQNMGYNVMALEKKGLLFRSPDAVGISSFSPTISTAGTMITLTITGTGFGATQGSGKVEFRNADNGGSGYMEPVASEYVSWSDTEIKVKIPSGAGTGDIRVTDDAGSSDVSSTNLNINYNITNITSGSEKYRTNLVDADGSGGIEFEFYTDFFNDADAFAAFERALGTWRCSNYGGTGVYFADGGSSTVDVIADDDVNIVRFDNGSELPSGVLGRMTSRYIGCSSGGVIEWYVKELDVVFDDNPGGGGYTWNFSESDNTTTSSQYDFESVAVHEVGHGHQLGHVIDGSQIMHYSISNGQEKRELSVTDSDAGDDVLNFSGSTCGQSAMNTFVCATIPLKLLSFNAEAKADIVMVNWEFENLLDLDKLELEKSKDGLNFENEYNIDLEDYNDHLNKFSFIDNNAFVNNYYRLKIYDVDGSYFYSKTIFVFNKTKVNKIDVFPNPFHNIFYILNKEKNDFDVEVINSAGKIIIKQTKVLRETSKKIDFNDFPNGIYYLKIKNNSSIKVEKIIKN